MKHEYYISVYLYCLLVALSGNTEGSHSHAAYCRRSGHESLFSTHESMNSRSNFTCAITHFMQHGPHWALFNLASLYWRSVGNGQYAIECLRRAIHFASNDNKDVGFIGLANTLQRHGYMDNAVVTSKAALDIRPDSVSIYQSPSAHPLLHAHSVCVPLSPLSP